MRLGQLARKLALRPGEIVDFLTSQNIPVQENSNSRLDERHVALTIQRFAPDRQEEIMNEPDQPEEETVENTLPVEAPEITEALPVPEPPAMVPAPGQELEEPAPVAEGMPGEQAAERMEPAEIVEVIKAPKVELPGLKVVGKIDLPEPKKKEPEPTEDLPAADAPATETKRPARPERGRPQGRRKPDRPKKNSVAAQREREAREAERRKRTQAKQEKEKRTLHYLKKVKPSVPTRPARLIDEPVVEMNEVFQDTGHPTLWGKFIKWLRRE